MRFINVSLVRLQPEHSLVDECRLEKQQLFDLLELLAVFLIVRLELVESE